jgi:hypothetical protein
MIVDHLSELPAEYECVICGASKPVGDMLVVRLRTRKKFLLRPRCKKCNNERERGHRREWKRKYLRRWRRDNAALNESYWRGRDRLVQNAISYSHFRRNHDAILIQGRLRRQLGAKVTLAEARELLRKHGCCYPTRYGLTPKGLRECERIRSRLRSARRSGQKVKMPKPVEIRMMVYDEGGHLRIKPRLQDRPYQRAARQLESWHAEQRRRKAA